VAAAKYPGSDKPVTEAIKDAVATIGENLSFRRSAKLAVGQGVVATYTHNTVAENLGKLGVLVAVETAGKEGPAHAIARQIAMHVAASSPLALTPEELDPAVVERERSIFAEQARQSGKPEPIIEKMVEGRLRKEFFGQVVLLQQTFLGPAGDGKMTVEQYLKAEEKGAGAPIKIAKFVRYALGEGIEKKDTDFAAEVAALTKN